MAVDPSTASGFPRVLPGQELSSLGSTLTEGTESGSSEKTLLWTPLLDDEKMNIVPPSRRYGSDHWLSSGRPESSFTDLLSGFGSQITSPRDFCMPSGTRANSKRQQEQEEKFGLVGDTWSIMPSGGLSLNLIDSSLKTLEQGGDTSYQIHRDVKYGAFREFSMIPDSRGDNQPTNWLMPPPTSSHPQILTAQSRELMPKSVSVQHDSLKPKKGNCKLFGIPLISNSVPLESALFHRNTTELPVHMLQGHLYQPPAIECDQSKGSKVDFPGDNSEQEKQFQTFHPVARDREGKVNFGSTRSCTKVHRHGTALGRSVELAKFNSYDELIAELDVLFEFNGELKARSKNWLVVYTDDEDDMMLVGDDPWEEFCGMVRKILILTKEEVHRMNPATFSSKEETSSVAQGLDAKEVKNLPTTSSSSLVDS